MARVSLQERLHPPALRDAVVDGEYRFLFEKRQRDRRVEEADVIERDDRVRPGLGDVLRAVHFEPIERAEDTIRKSRNGLVGMVRAIQATKCSQPRSPGTARAASRRRSARSATPTPPSVMNAALSTLTAAITRARRSAPAQACTAANAGTMNSPPAIASPARSTAIWMPAPDLKTSTSRRGRRRQVPRGPAEIERKNRKQHRGEKRWKQDDSAMREPGGEAGADGDRDRKDGEKCGDHWSSPPITVCTSGGSSESATAPISQNQLDEPAPPQPRFGLERGEQRNVERAILESSLRSGAARRTAGSAARRARSPTRTPS